MDLTLNRFLSSGTEAERAAFVPDPPTPASGPDQGYVWFATDSGLTVRVGRGRVGARGGGHGRHAAADARRDADHLARLGRPGRVGVGVYLPRQRGGVLHQRHALHERRRHGRRSARRTPRSTGSTSSRSTRWAPSSRSRARRRPRPSEPSVDPAQYLKLAIVFVAHATVAPPDVQTVAVYAEAVGTPTEWAWTSSGASIVVNAATTPHVGAKCIEGTDVVAGVYAAGTGASAIDPTDYDHLILFVRSKAAWNSSRGLLVTLRLAGVLVGAAVQMRRSGTFGFDSTARPTTRWSPSRSRRLPCRRARRIDQVRLEDFGGAIGFFVDDISFQVGATSAVGAEG